MAAFARQHWQKLVLETFSVLLGVVLGTQVSNWNQERREAADIRRLLDELKPGLQRTLQSESPVIRYFTITRCYANTALAGWAGDPRVSDHDFVIAAYQASQIVGSGTNDASVSAIFGGEKLLRIDDPGLRDAMIAVVTRRNDEISMAAVDTPYRHNVRSVLPEDVQEAVRRDCGDQLTNTGFMLPERCDIILPAQAVAHAAAALRGRPSLAEDLRWHISSVATFLLNLSEDRHVTQHLYDRIVANERP